VLQTIAKCVTYLHTNGVSKPWEFSF
jgi:hypothetical protein